MFMSKQWASAFVNSIEKDGGDIEDSVNLLKALAGSLPGTVYGRAAAIKLEPLVRGAIAKTAQGQETAVRFFLLMVKKNAVCHAGSIITEIKKIVAEKNGVIKVLAEYAFEPENGFISEIKELIKKRTGAAGVELTGQINAELIGGYRLKMGDEIIDASVRRQLQKMEACLAAVDGGS
jgi:F-type H+-transporting ATPase subunit delta